VSSVAEDLLTAVDDAVDFDPFEDDDGDECVHGIPFDEECEACDEDDVCPDCEMDPCQCEEWLDDDSDSWSDFEG
jgi:hypothetical protein